MPYWFRKQLMKAFLNKDIYQIRMLNECWYTYYASLRDEKADKQDRKRKQA